MIFYKMESVFIKTQICIKIKIPIKRQYSALFNYIKTEL